MNTCALFVDTNIYLHYRFFDQIPWDEIAQVSEATLVVPAAILSEIDKHKYGHRAKRVRDRADLVGRRFGELVESSLVVRTSVHIEFIATEPHHFDAHHLDKTSNDDRFIASVLEYIGQSPSTQVFIVTDDILMRVKAKNFGITVLMLPDEYRLPPELDADEAKIRDLQTKLRELQSAAPKLSIQFQNGLNNYHFERPEPTLEPSGDQLLRIRDKYPELWQEPRDRPGMVNALQYVYGPRISDYEVEQYNNALEEFFNRYEAYITACHSVDLMRSRSLIVNCELANSGTSPGVDVRVRLRIPNIVDVSDDLDVLSYPKKPTPPEKPRPSLYPNYRYLEAMPIRPFNPDDFARAMKVEPVMWLGVSSENEVSVASFEVQKLNHGFGKPCPRPIIVSFKDCASIRSFSIEYEISAANLPKKETGQLHVIVNPEVS